MNELINKEFKQGLITIAAKANVGKTTFLCSLASEAIKENKRILFLSLEKSKKSLLEHIKVDKIDNLIV